MTIQQVLTFIKTKKHAVISTCGPGNQPQAALIGFGETDNSQVLLSTDFTLSKPTSKLPQLGCVIQT